MTFRFPNALLLMNVVILVFKEISFWLNLERALHRIQEKRESVEVALTLDILKHGKRFHATVR